MNSDRLRQIEKLYHAARDRDEADRAAFLQQVCSDDELLREVESLLAFAGQAEDFLESPAVRMVKGGRSREPASPLSGTRFGAYDVLSLLGAGGMGEVYLAEDQSLTRRVALKILPEHLLDDETARKRFLREARSAAALDHPYVCSIFEVGEVDGRGFIAMEYVEGDTLESRLRRRPPSLKASLQITAEIAEALVAAHSQGIVHRDLKPSNIMLTRSGHVKVLDFGLAKRVDPAGEPDSSESTLTPETPAGLAVGTPAYMSPEQLRGHRLDTRSDIFSLGVVCYEMLTGTHPFRRPELAETISSILKDDPPALVRQGEVIPEILQHMVRKMLAKEPTSRFQSAHEIRTDVALIQQRPVPTPLEGAATGPARPGWQVHLPWTVAGLLAVIAGVALFLPRAGLDAPLQKLHLAEDGASLPLISPDGTSVVFAKDNSLWIRRLDQLESRRLEGTEGAGDGFWSPDSRFLGFARDDKLWRVSVSEGGTQVLCDLPTGMFRGGSWAGDDTIVFSMGWGLFQVPAQGGDAEQLLTIAQQDTRFIDPHVLPDGRGLLFSQMGLGRIELFDGEQRRVLVEREGAELTDPIHSPSGHLIFGRRGSNEGIWAVSFSLSTLQVTADEFKLTSDAGSPSVSNDGTLVFGPGGDHGRLRRLVWVSRTGEVLEEVSEPQIYMFGPALSPDESRVAVASREQGGGAKIWIHDIDRRTRRLLTFEENSTDWFPFWSVRGDQVGFSALRGNVRSIIIKAADGSGPEETVTEGSRASFSSDGRYLVYDKPGESTRNDLWYLEFEGDREPRPFLQTGPHEDSARLSPDGNYLAYELTDGGRPEVCLRRFPSGEGPWQVSRQGGHDPRWSKDGRELYYWSGTDLMVVDADTSASDPVRSDPRKLFSAVEIDVTGGIDYDVSGDGRFVMTRHERTPRQGQQPPIVVVQNWFAEFKDRP